MPNEADGLLWPGSNHLRTPGEGPEAIAGLAASKSRDELTHGLWRIAHLAACWSKPQYPGLARTVNKAPERGYRWIHDTNRRCMIGTDSE